MEGYWNILRECVYERELVTVFDYHKTLEIDVAILKSLLKGKHILLEPCTDLENPGVTPPPFWKMQTYKILIVNYQKQFLHPLKTIFFSLSQPLEKFCGSAHVNTLSSNNGLNDEWIMMSTRFLAANKDQEFDQLKLALAWNRIDIAKSEIFTEDKIWPVLTLLIIASIIYVPIKKIQ